MYATTLPDETLSQNTLRKSLYPERYPHNNVTFATGISDLEHLDHCINSIRENLMCVGRCYSLLLIAHSAM